MRGGVPSNQAAAIESQPTPQTQDVPGQTLSSDSAKILAHQLIQQSEDVQATVQRLMANGCDETQINFKETLGRNGFTNPNNSHSPSDGHCDVFNPNGGNLIFVLPSLDACDRSASICFSGIYDSGFIYGIGTGVNQPIWETADVLFSVCKSINGILGITFDITPDTTNYTKALSFPFNFSYNGLFNTYGSNQVLLGTSNKFNGLSMACGWSGSNPNKYTFYRVLWIR